MFVRAIVLSVALLFGIGVIVPFATEFAEAGSHKAQKKQKERRWKGVKKYSKRWWQLYRAQERRKAAVAKRKRNLRVRQIRMAQTRKVETGVSSISSPLSSKPELAAKPAPMAEAILPSGDAAPNGWRASQSSSTELQFRVDNSKGDQVASASISVIGPAASGTNNSRKSVGGISTTSLRREVIDRMIRENGWVVNDYQKEIAGQQVYVVVAQSQAKTGSIQSRMFYFTEVDGRIYSVATNSPENESQRIAEESEKVINSLKSRVRPALRAAVKE